MSCPLGIQRIVKETLNDKPWFKYELGDNYVYIVNSPDNRINPSNYIGVAKTTATAINKQINDGYKKIGDIAYPIFLNNKGVIKIDPSKKQLQLIEAQESEEIALLEEQIKLEQEHYELDSTLNESNSFISDEGNVVVKDDLFESKKNLNDLVVKTVNEFGVTKLVPITEDVRYEFSEEIKNAIFGGTPKNITAKEALKNILNSAHFKSDSKTQELINKMYISTKANIKIIDSKDLKSSETYMQYNTTDNTIEIVLDNLGDVSSIEEGISKFLHEVIHDRTIRITRVPKNASEQKLRDDIKLIYDNLKDVLDSEFPHEMSSLEEFIAGMFSNKQFEQSVENLVNVKETFWDKLKSFFIKLFNLDNSYDKLLNSIIQMVDTTDETYIGEDTLEAKYNINRKVNVSKKGLETINNDINKTIEDLIKTTSRNGAPTTYLDRLKVVQKDLNELLDKYEKGSNEQILESINVFNKFMNAQLHASSTRLDNISEFNTKLYNQISVYNNMFMTMQTEIKTALHELKRNKTISEEDFNELFSEIEKTANISYRLKDRLYDAAKNYLIDNNNLFSDQYKEVYLDYERKYRQEGRQQGLVKYELDQYVNKKLSENRDLIQKESQDAFIELISSPINDISNIGAALNSEKDFTHPIIRMISRILDSVKQTYQTAIQPKLLEIQSEAEKFLEGNRLKSSDKINENLIDWSEDGTGHLKGKYSIGFRDSFNKMMDSIKDLEQDDPIRKSTMKKWFKENTYSIKSLDENGQIKYITKPDDKWKNDLSKLSEKERNYLKYITSVAEESNQNYGIAAKSLKKTTLGVTYYQLPSQHKDMITHIKNTKGLDTFKEIYNDTFKLRTDDTTMGELDVDKDNKTAFVVYTDISGKEIKYIPIHYRNKVDRKYQSIDLATLYSLEYQNSVKFKEKTKVHADINMFIDVIQEQKFVKKQGLGQRIISRVTGNGNTEAVLYNKEDSNLLKQLETMLNNRLYDKTSKYIGKVGNADVAKIESFIRGTVSKAGMGLKLIGAPVNFVTGKSQTVFEIIKDPNLKIQNFWNAEAFFIKHLGGTLNDMGRNVYKSLPNQLLLQYGGLVTSDMLQNNFEKNKTLALTNTKALFFFQEGGEHWVQAIHTMTILDAAKILDKDGNFLDKDGNITTVDKAASVLDISTLKNGNLTTTIKKPFYTTLDRMKPYQEGGDATIRSYIQSSLIKSQGQYSIEYQSELQRHVLGKMLFHFKKHILSPGLNRWRGAATNIFGKEEDMIFNYDTDLQRVDEGTYVTYLRFLIRSVIPKIAKLKLTLITKEWNEMDDWEKNNIKRALSEVALITLTGALAGLFAGAASDDDDYSFFWYLAAIFRRVESDASQFYNINEAWRVVKNPISTLKFLESSTSVLGAVTNYIDPFEEERNEKLEKSIGKMGKYIIPGVGVFDNPHEQYNYVEK